jgi:hypothetical protein
MSDNLEVLSTDVSLENVAERLKSLGQTSVELQSGGQNNETGEFGVKVKIDVLAENGADKRVYVARSVSLQSIGGTNLLSAQAIALNNALILLGV